jgi:hypothetical protein
MDISAVTKNSAAVKTFLHISFCTVTLQINARIGSSVAAYLEVLDYSSDSLCHFVFLKLLLYELKVLLAE